VIAGRSYPSGQGTSKKQAEQGAAEHAFNALSADQD
jgi:dsRNA-specific ribonuclease